MGPVHRTRRDGGFAGPTTARADGTARRYRVAFARRPTCPPPPLAAAMTAAALLLSFAVPLAGGGPGDDPAWTTTRLTDAFTAEGAAAADFDADGRVDLAVGPYLYRGPDWTTRTEYKPPASYSPLGYSEEFLTFAADLTGDGRPDIVSVGWPGKETYWFENPGPDRDYRSEGHWPRHILAPVVDNESPGLADLTGDGFPELIGQSEGAYGYFRAGDDVRAPWRFHPVSPADPDRGRYTHGLGAGDIDGDGRTDLLTKDGWYRQPADLSDDPVWEEYAVPFAEKAAQILAFDVDGDGDADVVTARQAHGYGLDWWENQLGEAADPGFVRHEIMGDADSNAAPVLFSQLHALAAADVNGDGLTDVVTGKRFFAHGPDGDADPLGAPALYWWELTRGPGGPSFVPHRIDDASGVGCGIHCGDVTGDGKPDVVVGNKRGAFVSVRE